NVASGISPDKSFQFGDVDNVNSFNGNLTLTLPLGMSYPVNGGFSYQLQLVHNSNPWFFFEMIDSDTVTRTEGMPSPCANAGIGWRVSFGELDPFCSPSDTASHIYEDP